MKHSRTTSLLLNIAHAIDHLVLLIFATAVGAIAADFGLARWEDLMPFTAGAFVMFGLGSLPSGRLGDLWGRRAMMLIFFFGIGYVPGLFATILFALPPGVRLTELGIRQVDAETVEAGQAFGATPRQILRGIQVPLAVPTIMAGINQVIMLALSMAVIAGMVGADGLGKKVVESISTINIGLGAEAGLSVVVLAIYLDRLTASIGGSGAEKSLGAMIRRSKNRSVAQRATTGI